MNIKIKEIMQRTSRQVLVLGTVFFMHFIQGAAHAAQYTYEPYEFNSDDDYFTDSDRELPSVERLKRYDQSGRNQLLYNKASAGKLPLVKKLVAAKAEVNYKRASETKNQPLYGSIWAGDVKTVQFLLKHKADVHSTARPRQLPIHRAAQQGNIDIFKLLVQYGADVNARERPEFDDACIPLERASRAGKLPMVVHMLENHGHVLYKKGKNDSYYLLFAAAGCQKLPLPDLLNAVVAATQLPEAVCTLVIMPYADMVAAALASDPNIHDSRGQTPLHIAARAQNVPVCKYLLVAKAYLEAQTFRGERPLHHAVNIVTTSRESDKYDIQMYNFLVQHGADIHGRNYSGITPLQDLQHYQSEHLCSIIKKSCEQEALLEIPQLVASGVMVNRPFSVRAKAFPMQPLAKAVEKDCFVIADWLVQHGNADPNIQSEKGGQRPLHYACRKYGLAMIQFLLQAKASADLTNNDGHTPLMEAAATGATDVVDALLQSNADPNKQTPVTLETALWFAALHNKPHVMRKLIEYKACAHVKDNEGVGLLGLVARPGYKEAWQIVLEAQKQNYDDLADEGKE